MAGKVFDFDTRFKKVSGPVQRGHGNLRGLFVCQFAARSLRSGKSQDARAEHVISRADAENLRELLKEHQPELIKTDKSVTRIRVAHLHPNILVRGAAVGEGISIVFDVRDAKSEFEIAQLGRHVAILTSTRGGTIEGLAFVLIRAVLPLRISHLLVKLFWLSGLV